jgi:hypothetical protein
MVVSICPPELHHDRSVVRSHLVEHPMQVLWRLYNIVWNKVIGDNTQVFVSDNKWYIIAIVDDACNQRIFDIVAHCITIYSLHSRSPQLHIQLLLAMQSLRHTIAQKQRNSNKDCGEYQYYYSTILQHPISQPP